MVAARQSTQETINWASPGLNQVTLIGRLGRSPEMRYTPDGKPVASFSVVATHSFAASNGDRHEETDWFNIVVWGTLAETCKKNLYQGQRVCVQGRMKTRRWTDENQVEHSCAEVIAQALIPLQRRTGEEQMPPTSQSM